MILLFIPFGAYAIEPEDEYRLVCVGSPDELNQSPDTILWRPLGLTDGYWASATYGDPFDFSSGGTQHNTINASWNGVYPDGDKVIRVGWRGTWATLNMKSFLVVMHDSRGDFDWIPINFEELNGSIGLVDNTPPAPGQPPAEISYAGSANNPNHPATTNWQMDNFDTNVDNPPAAPFYYIEYGFTFTDNSVNQDNTDVFVDFWTYVMTETAGEWRTIGVKTLSWNFVVMKKSDADAFYSQNYIFTP